MGIVTVVMSLLFRAKKDQLTPLVVHNITPDEADPDDTDGKYTHKTHACMHAHMLTHTRLQYLYIHTQNL